jgi:hypothetical protein
MRWYSRLTLREPLTNKVAEQDTLQRHVTLGHGRKWQERQDKYEELIKRNRKTVQSTSVQSTGVQNTLCTQKSMYRKSPKFGQGPQVRSMPRIFTKRAQYTQERRN